MYLMKKAAVMNGEHLLLTPLDIDFARRTISLTGEITGEAAEVVCSALRCLARDSDDDITLYLQTPGGSVAAGLYIYDTMKALRCDVVTVACGMTASMGAVLLAAGTKGKRWCQPNAEVLLHQPLGGTSGQATDIKIHAEHILNLRARINGILAACCGRPLVEIARDTERDFILNAEDALAYGLVDKLGDPVSEW